jgi:hypothetical protein
MVGPPFSAHKLIDVELKELGVRLKDKTEQAAPVNTPCPIVGPIEEAMEEPLFHVSPRNERKGVLYEADELFRGIQRLLISHLETLAFGHREPEAVLTDLGHGKFKLFVAE